MRILYITRKFPPSIGGMQTQSHQFYKSISKENDVVLISWGHSQLFLPLFVFLTFIRSVVVLSTSRIEIIQLGDLVLSPLGALLKSMFKKSTFTVSHGRDSAYSGLLYDRLILGSAKYLDGIICVSNNMRQRFISRGLPAERLEVIPNGVSTDGLDIKEAKRGESVAMLESHYGIRLKEKRIILSVSRLVAKKGIKEFIEDIFVKIEPAVFLIAGEGPEKKRIAWTIERLRLTDRVYLLGPVKHDSDIFKALFAASDLFVMPNIKVKGDAEGFGVVALEAALMGVPVIAYDVDGIADAVHDDENGILIREGDIGLFIEKTTSLLKDDTARKARAKKARLYVTDNFNWDNIVGRYLDLYSGALKMHG